MSAAVASDRSNLRKRGIMLSYIFSNQGWGLYSRFPTVEQNVIQYVGERCTVLAQTVITSSLSMREKLHLLLLTVVAVGGRAVQLVFRERETRS